MHEKLIEKMQQEILRLEKEVDEYYALIDKADDTAQPIAGYVGCIVELHERIEKIKKAIELTNALGGKYE